MSPTPPLERRLRVLLCGYGHLGLALLQGMLECADLCEVVGVFRWSSRPASRHCWEPVEGLLQKLVADHGIRDIQCTGVNSYEFIELLNELKPDVLLVGAWGEILKKHLLSHPNLLLVNCHPSKLPAHRGANPYASVIREQEAETGVTFHRISPEIDAGAIILQETVALTTCENGASVRDKCVGTAYQMTRALIPRLSAHCLQGEPLEEQVQDISQKSYFPPLRTEDGLLDWHASAEAIDRQYRALYPWIPCHSHIRGKRMLIFYDPTFKERPAFSPDTEPGTVLSNQNGVLRVSLADPQWTLEISQYQLARGQSFWSPAWSRLLALWLLRPGQRLYSPG